MSDWSRDALLFAVLLAVLASGPKLPDGLAIAFGVLAVVIGFTGFAAGVTSDEFGVVVPEDDDT